MTMANQTTTIPKGWKTTTLGNIPESWNLEIAESYCEKVADGTHATPKPVERGKHLITSKHIKDGRVDLSSAYKISENDFIEINKRSKVNQWDVLFSMIGTVGEIALIDRVPDYAIKNVGLFKCGEESRAKWLYYFLRGKIGQDEIQRRMNGTTQSYVTLGDLRSFPLIIPSSNTELKAIVAVLSSLDDKIELLREENKILEATAQAIFKEWFVNFNLPAVVLTKAGFPDGKIKMIDSELGKIPEGWRVGNLTELFDFIKGIEPGSHNYSVKKLSEDYLPFYRVQDTLNYNKTPNVFVDKRILNGKIFKKDDILISLDGTIGRIFIGGSGGYSSGIRKVVGKESFISKFLIFCFLKSDKFQGELNSFAGAETTIKHAGGAIEHIKFVFEKSICEEFGKITNPLFQKMVFNNFQIQTLSTLRDFLLPKLMKGELRVKI